MAFLYFRFFLEKPKEPYSVVTFSISRPDGMTEKMAEFKVPVNDVGKVEGLDVSAPGFTDDAVGHMISFTNRNLSVRYFPGGG